MSPYASPPNTLCILISIRASAYTAPTQVPWLGAREPPCPASAPIGRQPILPGLVIDILTFLTFLGVFGVARRPDTSLFKACVYRAH